MTARAAIVLSLAACGSRAAVPVAPPPAPGIAIAMYSGGDSVIDDRRWVDVKGDTLELDHVDPGAALASLVIEPLTGAPMQVGTCTRDRIPDQVVDPARPRRAHAAPPWATLPRIPPPPPRPTPPSPPAPAPASPYLPVVRCAVIAAPGRYLVRVLYATPTLSFRAEHALAVVTPAHATLASHYAIVTPVWHARANVAIYDGAPGGARPLVELARGDVELDGTTAVLATAPHDVAAQLRRVYAGADASVWVWLELAHVHLVPGLVRLHLELPDEGTIDADITPAKVSDADAPVRLRLWSDDALRGIHQRTNDFSDGAQLAERVVLSVSNRGDTPREVWLEEPLRAAHHVRIERVTAPSKLGTTSERVRARVVVEPGRAAQVAFTAAYDL